MQAPHIRPAAVAGMFYPNQPQVLGETIANFFNRVNIKNPLPKQTPKALVVPHAGYQYSGQVAAEGYARILPNRHNIKRVVLLGPTHRVAIRGMAYPSHDFFQTPLGSVTLDPDARKQFAQLSYVKISDAQHAAEHALEVQLPFLQAILDDFTLVPLAVGQASPEQVAEVLACLWGGDESLIVISSDLSHFHPYDEAQSLDQSTANAILALNTTLKPTQACGAAPLNGFLHYARQQQLHATMVSLKNSGDTAGDKNRVVGYGSFAFYQPTATTTTTTSASPSEKSRVSANTATFADTLLALARYAIDQELRPTEAKSPSIAEPQRFSARQASFVTLNLNGRLRGCIGSLTARRPLADDVYHNARAAAFKDPRFAPLSLDEWRNTKVEISLLTAPEAMEFTDEQDVLKQLQPGQDGLILLAPGGHQATYLPQVWQQLPTPTQFLQQLKIKAGLAADAWPQGVQLLRYRAEKYS